MVLWLVPLLAFGYYVGYVNDFPGVGSPLHASCEITWEWKQTDCHSVHQTLLKQIALWTPEDNCKEGGQKCLYTLLEEKENYIKATHTTPIKRYVDTMVFNFKDQGNGGCLINVSFIEKLIFLLLIESFIVSLLYDLLLDFYF